MNNGSTSILLVEDSMPDARYVQELLSNRKYIVAHASNLAQAQSEVSMKANSFDVVLLDLSLPDGKGLQTFSSMIEQAPKMPILILTGLDDEDLALQAVKLGAQDYILKKELNEYSLSRAIRYAIERKSTEENSKRLAVLEQREEFMATLTHDLKNPLIGANYVLGMMADQVLGVVTEEQADLLQQVRDSNKLLLSMIQNLIEVYKFEKDGSAVYLENINLRDIISTCLLDIAPIARNRDINLETNFPEQIREVRADANAIHRVVQNLLDNALKFTPTGGRIAISISPTNGHVKMDIKDSGPGISPEEQTLLFQRFSQGKIGRKFTPGTGLGLYLCKQIIDAHGGTINCTSTEGSGTTFEVILPAAS
jgi:two-component system, sensor histidine kinase and response regulator